LKSDAGILREKLLVLWDGINVSVSKNLVIWDANPYRVDFEDFSG